MRKLFGVLAAAVIAIGAAAPAGAATVSGSTMSIVIGALPGVTAPQSPDPATISVTGGGGFTVQAGSFNANVILPTQLFTGVNLISSLNMSFGNASGVMAPGAGLNSGFGGPMAVTGSSTVGVLGGLINLVIPLGNAGVGGTTKVAAFSLNVTVTGAAGWTTGTAKVTGITTTLPGGTIVNTLTGTGSDGRVGGVGIVKLVTPVRVLTNAAGNLPVFATMILNFVPEPGTLLLLGSGVVGLAVVGRKRMRK